MAININHPTSHIYQVNNDFCWAAALAMVLGRHSLNGAVHVMDMAAAAGIRTPMDGLRLDSSPVQLIRAVGLSPYPGPSPLTVQSLADHLRHWRCALFVALRGVPRPNGHVYVLSGMRGDGGDSTTLYLHDPNRTRGVATVSFREFVNTTIESLDHIARR